MIFWFCLAVICAYLLIEKHCFVKARSSIPVRIHVYGTRGKTTTTSHLFDVLKAAQWTVYGKTTGDSPQVLLPNGETRTLQRFAPARIHEYVGCLKEAARLNCDAVVFECMALAPESITMARNIFSPTHVVMTNTRPDHYESMGATPTAIAETLALSIGKGSVVFATEDQWVNSVRTKTLDNGGVFHGVPCEDEPPLSQANRMVKEVAAAFLISPVQRDVSSEWPRFERCSMKEMGEFLFLDLFSANDVLSSEQLLNHALEEFSRGEKHRPSFLVALLATRPDRPLRTRVFVDWLAANEKFSHRIFLGWHSYYAQMAMHRKKYSGSKRNSSTKCILNPMQPPLQWMQEIKKKTRGNFALVGLGNAHGYGELFRSHVDKEDASCS